MVCRLRKRQKLKQTKSAKEWNKCHQMRLMAEQCENSVFNRHSWFLSLAFVPFEEATHTHIDYLCRYIFRSYFFFFLFAVWVFISFSRVGVCVARFSFVSIGCMLFSPFAFTSQLVCHYCCTHNTFFPYRFVRFFFMCMRCSGCSPFRVPLLLVCRALFSFVSRSLFFSCTHLFRFSVFLFSFIRSLSHHL